MKKYQMVRKWKRSFEDENVQLEALFDALYVAGKVSEDDLFGYLHAKWARKSGYLYPRREAAWRYLRYHLTYKGDAFLNKMNCYNHSPIDLANQIHRRVLDVLKDEHEGVAFYTCTGAPAVNGTIVCMGKMQDGQYITNPAEGAPRQLMEKFTPADILFFLGKYSKWLKDPLLMFGLWRTYAKGKYGPWLMCLCHHLGTGRREDYYEYGLAAECNCIDYTGSEF